MSNCINSLEDLYIFILGKFDVPIVNTPCLIKTNNIVK